MSFVERRKEFRPKTGEAPFNLDEVFFSRTDERGVIQSGNYIFRRVAHYDWKEMVGAPHKIIRHPDMPKGVFWLLWDTIKRGQPISAYVKNKAQDGLYYWVIATVMPCKGGYLSVRIKPTTPVFDIIRKEYAKLLAAERENKLTPEQSAAHLLERVQALGFDDYAHFSTKCLSDELVARDAGLDWPLDKAIARSRRILKLAKELGEETTALIRGFESMRTIPHNMRVIASRLEPTGGPVSTLSQNYGTMSQEISDWFEQHVNGPESNFSTIRNSTNHAIFLQCMSRILTEASNQLLRERRRLGDINLEQERATLAELKEDYVKKTRLCTQQVAEEAGRILAACRTMHRQVLGLSTTRVMCKIEGARITRQGESLNDIIMQLETFQSRNKNQLDRIGHIAEQIIAG